MHLLRSTRWSQLSITRWNERSDGADEALRVTARKSSNRGYANIQRSRVLAFGTDLSGAWIARRMRNEWGVTMKWSLYLTNLRFRRAPRKLVRPSHISILVRDGQTRSLSVAALRSAYGVFPRAGDRERTPLARGSNFGRRTAKACHETGSELGYPQVPVLSQSGGWAIPLVTAVGAGSHWLTPAEIGRILTCPPAAEAPSSRRRARNPGIWLSCHLNHRPAGSYGCGIHRWRGLSQAR